MCRSCRADITASPTSATDNSRSGERITPCAAARYLRKYGTMLRPERALIDKLKARLETLIG
jgi:hypothetical protein